MTGEHEERVAGRRLRRRRLFAGITLILAVFGAWILLRYTRHTRAVAKVQVLGGTVDITDTPTPLLERLPPSIGRKVPECWPFHRNVRSVGFSDWPVGDGDLHHLRDLWGLEQVAILSCYVTDKGLLELARLPHIREVYLDNNFVSKAGVKAFKAARPGVEIYANTERLTFQGTQEQFPLVSGMHDLWELHIGRPINWYTPPWPYPICDSDLSALSQLKNLAILDLGPTRITPQGLAHLRQLDKLSMLAVDFPITDEVLEQLALVPNLSQLPHSHRSAQAGT